MRIVVNDIAASKWGAMAVLRDFYHCVCENDTENEWIFLLNDRYFEETDNVKIIPMPQVKKSGVHKMLFDFVTGRRFIASLKPDVVFSMQNIITFGLKAPQVVYMHQSLPFQSVKKFSFWNKKERKSAVYQHLVGAIIKRSLKKCDTVIVQAGWIKDAVCQKCRIAEDKVFRVLPSVKALNLKEGVTPDNTRFFYPTGVASYKNNQLVFDACDILNRKGLQYEATLTVEAESAPANVRCVGRIPFEEVVERYQNSVVLFPSYIETFGYPLAEARQAGAIVLASDTPFAREVLVGYDNAYFFDPFNPQELADLMERVIRGDIVRRETPALQVEERNSWVEVMDIVRRTV